MKLNEANKEYDKALASFKLALDEGSNNKEVKRLTTLIDNYKKANDEFEKGNINDANKIMNQIDEETIEDSIKNDIDNLKSKISEKQKIDKEILHIRELIKDKKYNNLYVCENCDKTSNEHNFVAGKNVCNNCFEILSQEIITAQ